MGRVSILPATAAKTLPCHFTVYTVTLRYSQRWVVSPFCQQQQPKRCRVTLQSTQSHYATASGGSCLHSASNSSQNVAMSLYSLHSHTTVTLRYSQRWVVSPFCQQQQPKRCCVTVQFLSSVRSCLFQDLSDWLATYRIESSSCW